MTNSNLLSMTTKEKDTVICEKCKKGIMIPFNPKYEKNHTFICNECNETINIEEVIVVK